jgi:hypothetical protein
MKVLTDRIAQLIFACAAVALLGSSPALANPTRWDLRGDLVTARVIVNDATAPLFSKPWSWAPRTGYFEATQGGHYELELTNHSNRRVGVLVSVDGLNVVTGERSSLSAGESMYVLNPYQSMTLRGWRSSMNEVRQFVFVDEERSYAERTGQANGDLGWIRVAAFDEQRPVSLGMVRDDDRDQSRCGGSPEAAAPAPQRGDERAQRTKDLENDKKSEAKQSLDGLARNEATRQLESDAVPGTGWGDRRNDPVTRVQFTAQSVATDQLIFRYEYASGLRALGIFPRHARVWERENGELGFAQPPTR